MRSYNQCFSWDLSCKISFEHDFYENCFRSIRKCDLTSNLTNMNKIIRESEKLNQKFLKMKQKIVRFRILRRYWYRKFRELDDKENTNLLKLKKEKYKKIKWEKMIFRSILLTMSINSFLLRSCNECSIFFRKSILSTFQIRNSNILIIIKIRFQLSSVLEFVVIFSFH